MSFSLICAKIANSWISDERIVTPFSSIHARLLSVDKGVLGVVHSSDGGSGGGVRIPTLPKRHQQFGASVVVHLVFPLTPLLLEFFIHSDGIKLETLAITASIFSVTVGSASKSAFFLFVGVLFSFMFSALFGVVISGGKIHPVAEIFLWVAIIFVGLAHAVERWNMHVHDKIGFWGG